MIHGVDTSFLVAVELVSHGRHGDQLGRKRLLDTIMAATFHVAGIQSVVTLNRSDFGLFGCFTIQEP
jgi:hypothetical protein